MTTEAISDYCTYTKKPTHENFQLSQPVPKQLCLFTGMLITSWAGNTMLYRTPLQALFSECIEVVMYQNRLDTLMAVVSRALDPNLWSGNYR